MAYSPLNLKDIFADFSLFFNNVSSIFGSCLFVGFQCLSDGILLLIMPSYYRISTYTFRGNYSFLNLEIQRSQYIRPKVTVHKCAETIQGQKLYEEIRYFEKNNTN